MRNNIKKVLVIVPMVFLLCMSFVGITAKADVKVNQSNVVESTSTSSENNSTSSGSNNQNKVDAANSKSTNTTATAGTNGTEKSTSSADGKNNQSSSGTQSTETTTMEVLPAWKNINGKLYYVDKDGIVKKTGWFKEKDVNPDAKNDDIFYLDKDYSATIGWKKIDNAWYYFNETGIKLTGWQYLNYGWCYLDKNGMMQTGWLKDKGNKYYLNEDGLMVSGKKYIDGNWYYFASNGNLQIGFYFNKDKLYYSTNDGVMVANQWVETKTSKYYIKADSSVATGYAIIDNTGENFDSYGRYLGPTQMKDYLYARQLNVGDADCAFIKLPDGETALIDTGTPDTAQKVIDFLKSQDLKQDGGKGVIDYVIVTHAHSDHIGGLPAILDNFKVGKVYMPDIAVMKDWYSNIKVTADTQSDVQMMKHDYEVYNNAVNAMKEKGIKFTNTKKGEFIDKNKILQFVQSDKSYGGIGSDKLSQYYWGINENSSVVYLNYGDLKELFTGDMEWNSEKDFWSNNLLNGNTVNVLKVPHHGNDTSSTTDFLNYLKPTIGIISRSKESSKQNTAYNNLLSTGISIYETNSKDNGIGIYSTKENWTIQN